MLWRDWEKHKDSSTIMASSSAYLRLKNGEERRRRRSDHYGVIWS